MDLVCGPRIAVTAEQLARSWGRDRALSSAAIDRLSALVLAAIGHGLRFGPRGVTIKVQWLDRDRVRIDVMWRECSGRAARSVPGAPGTGGNVEATAAMLDALAESWGFGTSRADPHQWIVLDTR